MLETQKTKIEQLYTKYWRLMCHAATGILKNPADVEDAVQQAFLYLMLHIDKVGDVDSPATKSYVALVAKHRAIDLYRSRRRCEPVCDINVGAVCVQPERLGVMEAISQLPPRDRDVLLLRFWEGYSSEEIAGMLNMKRDSVQKMIWRAKKKLADKLAED